MLLKYDTEVEILKKLNISFLKFSQIMEIVISLLEEFILILEKKSDAIIRILIQVMLGFNV